MLKSLIILFNYFLFTIVGLFLQRIEVTQEIPARLNPGESAEITVIINKGKIEGFAKFQLNVDPGLVIESIDNSGASFTFSDNKAKFIWMSVPTANTITIKYKLTALPTCKGVKKIEGTFSYIDENQRLVYDIPTQTVATGDAEPITDNNSISNSNAVAQVVRKVTPKEEGRYTVELTINKSGIEGFAKLQEEIPADYTAIGKDSQGSVFNIVDQRVKFVWFSVPEENELVLTYELIPVLKEASQEFELDGEFAFLVQNETQSVPVTGSYSKVTDQEVASETTSIEEHFEELDNIAEKTEEAIIENTANSTEIAFEELAVIEKTVVESTPQEIAPIIAEPTPKVLEEVAVITPKPTENVAVAKSTHEAPKPVSKAPNPETTIAYRIQITAAHKVVDSSYFKERHKYNGEFIIENHEGWVKYTTSKSDNYKSARDNRTELVANYNFPGPFVVAYNAGERITVQEALMISNQKWFP